MITHGPVRTTGQLYQDSSSPVFFYSYRWCSAGLALESSVIRLAAFFHGFWSVSVPALDE
jgi:hypothetical protein